MSNRQLIYLTGLKLTRDKFAKIVNKAYERIPEEFRNKIDNISIEIEDYPTPNDLEKIKIRKDSLLLGLYRGTPLPKRSIWQGIRLPDQIVLFQKDIEKVCRSEKEIEAKVNEVLIHEIAHYFGLSDEEIYRIMG